VLLEDERPLILATSREQAEDAGRRLRAVGFGELRGYVLHGPETETLPAVEVDELERLLAEDAVEVIDVRELHERDDGFIPGSRNIPYRLVRDYGDELREGRPVVTICESGARAAVAASVLAAAGVDARPVLHGGMRAWEERGGSTVGFRRCGS